MTHTLTRPVAVTAPLDFEIMTVTPELAAEWLAHTGKNRRLIQQRVDAYAAAMHRGEWELTGDSIKFDRNGELRDGQNRLHAIVKSGVPIQTAVVRGVSEPAINVMDIGRTRTTGDVLWMNGYAYQNALSGAARLLLFYERFGRFNPNQREARTLITPVTTLNYVQAHPDIESGVRLGERLRSAGFMGGISVWSALMTMFNRIDTEATYQFIHYLTTGQDMSAGHPVLALRNKLGRLHASGETRRSLNAIGREEMAAWVIKAWNAFRKGRSVHVLSWSPDEPRYEAFPQPL